MTLEDRLRRALADEAAALPGPPPAPEMAFPASRVRTHRAASIAVAAAVVVALLIGGVALLLLGGDDEPPVVTTPDGPYSWTRSDPGAPQQNFGGIAYGPAGFVTVGSAQSLEDPGFSAVSADGADWTVVAVPEFAEAQVMGLAATNAGYLAVGLPLGRRGGPLIWRSGDGLAWESAELPVPEAVADAQVQPFPTALAGRGDVAIASGIAFAEGGEARSLFWRSDDGGATWSVVEGPFGGGGGLFLAAGPGGFVASTGGEEQPLHGSPDGLSWSPSAGAPPGLVGPISGGERGYVAVVRTSPGVDAGEVWWSADGVAWEPVHVLPTLVLGRAAAGPDGFAVALTFPPEDGGIPEDPWDQRFVVIFSADGRGWTEAAPLGVLPQGFVLEAAAVGDDAIAVGGFPPIDPDGPPVTIAPAVLVGTIPD